MVVEDQRYFTRKVVATPRYLIEQFGTGSGDPCRAWWLWPAWRASRSVCLAAGAGEFGSPVWLRPGSAHCWPPRAARPSRVLRATTCTKAGPASCASPADPGYRAAKQQWIAEGLVVSGAARNPPLDVAVTDLEHGDVADAGGTSAYHAPLAEGAAD